MKYIKLLNSNEEKSEFEKTIDYCPIVVLTYNEQEVEDSVTYYDKDDIVINDDNGNDDTGNDTIQFPVYLETGTTTQLGADLYKYIIDNNIQGAIHNNETIIIYVDNKRVFAINISDNFIMFTDGGAIFDQLYPDGNLICECDM